MLNYCFSSELPGNLGEAIVSMLTLDKTDIKAKCQIRDTDNSQL